MTYKVFGLFPTWFGHCLSGPFSSALDVSGFGKKTKRRSLRHQSETPNAAMRSRHGPSRTILSFDQRYRLHTASFFGLSRILGSVRDSIPSLRGCCTVSNLRRVGRGARGFLEWNSWTKVFALFSCDYGSHEFSESGYPCHLTRYWTPFLLGVSHDCSIISTS